MGLKVYLPLAVIAFIAATIGADIYARTSIGDEAFGSALSEHLYYASVQFVGTLFLSAPFVTVALICAWAERKSRSRIVTALFGSSMLVLLYFYFQGYLASQHAMQEEKWTAATLSIGLLPFFIGIPVVLVVAVAIAASSFSHRSD